MRKRRLPVSWSRPQTAVRALNPVPLTPESVLFLASMKPKQWKTTGRPVETLRLGITQVEGITDHRTRPGTQTLTHTWAERSNHTH